MSIQFSGFESALMISLLEEKEQAIKAEFIKNERKIQVLMEENVKHDEMIIEITVLRERLS